MSNIDLARVQFAMTTIYHFRCVSHTADHIVISAYRDALGRRLMHL